MREDTVVQLRQPGSFADDPLTEVLRLGARRLLGQAVEAEVAGFVEAYAHLTGSAGRRRIVRHGYLPEREIQTGIGPVAVRLRCAVPGCATEAPARRGRGFASPHGSCLSLL